jgi:hypothetical protein
MLAKNSIIDTNKIFVFDDVAPEWLYESFRHRIKEAQRWKYGMAATRSDYGRFFVLWVAQAGTHRGNRGPFAGDVDNVATYCHDLWVDKLLPTIIPDGQVVNIHRVHFNGQFPTQDKLAVHLDWDMKDMWTLLYYLDGEDGDTVFYENPVVDDSGEMHPPEEAYRVKFRKNRMVFFPSFYWHAGENPKEGFRISLAFNYTLNSRCKINQELRKDRGIVEPTLGEPDLSDFLSELDHIHKLEEMHKKMQKK